jgi:hypothetical protein
MAMAIPRLTVARLIVWNREQGQDLAVVAARVLTDVLATEPGLLELTPGEAAEEAAALIQTMWPQGAFIQRRLTQPKDEKEVVHPVVDKLRKLGELWHRLAKMPIDQAKQRGPAAWRRKVLSDIALAKAEGLKAGLSRDRMLAALEMAGDRWVWEIPPPARDLWWE